MTPNYPACYVLVKKGNKLLFVLRENTGYMDGNYSLPAGRVEEAETFLAGAAREALEEVGLQLDTNKLKHAFTMHRFSETSDKPYWVDVFFEAPIVNEVPSNAAPHEHSKIDWLDIDNLPDNIMDYQKFAVEQIILGKTYGEFGWPKE